VKAWIQRDDHHVCCWPLDTGYRKRKKRRDWVTIFWCCLCPSTLIPVAHTRKSVKEPTAEPGEWVRMGPMLPHPFCVFFFLFGEVQQQTRYDKPLAPPSQDQEGRQEFHLHTTGLEPRTFCSHSILEWANISER
jgi:hypothetical protein